MSSNRATRLFLLASLLLCTSQFARAQPGIVADSRRLVWPNVGIAGAIRPRPTICGTPTPGATAAAINAAIAACPTGQTVFLAAGTYNIDGIDFGGGKSNVTLRGAGANQTLIVFNSTASVGCNGWFPDVCIHSSDTNYKGGPSNIANWSSSTATACPPGYSGACYPRGLNTITLSSTTNLAVGKPLILDQLNDDTSGSSFSDRGAIYVCAVSSCSDDSSGGPGGAARPGRDQI